MLADGQRLVLEAARQRIQAVVTGWTAPDGQPSRDGSAWAARGASIPALVPDGGVGILSELAGPGAHVVESTLTLSDAKARFSEIVEKATNGEEFIVTRMGKPVVRITRFTAHGRPRKLGDFAGRIRMSEDFDDWPPDLQEALGMAEPR